MLLLTQRAQVMEAESAAAQERLRRCEDALAESAAVHQRALSEQHAALTAEHAQHALALEREQEKLADVLAAVQRELDACRAAAGLAATLPARSDGPFGHYDRRRSLQLARSLGTVGAGKQTKGPRRSEVRLPTLDGGILLGKTR